ncbi:MAG: hypothetical protein ACJA1Q_002491, partial [Pseudohongiellaceae bacterium]
LTIPDHADERMLSEQLRLPLLKLLLLRRCAAGQEQ